MRFGGENVSRMPENKLPTIELIKTFGMSSTADRNIMRYHRVDRLNTHFARININIIRIAKLLSSAIRIIVSSLLYVCNVGRPSFNETTYPAFAIP
jgi:hypothetical protein